jgi:N-acetylmuramic acid 6-phosphate etherase
MVSITESPSVFQYLDRMSVSELLTGMNQQDAQVPLVIKEIIPRIE